MSPGPTTTSTPVQPLVPRRRTDNRTDTHRVRCCRPDRQLRHRASVVARPVGPAGLKIGAFESVLPTARSWGLALSRGVRRVALLGGQDGVLCRANPASSALPAPISGTRRVSDSDFDPATAVGRHDSRPLRGQSRELRGFRVSDLSVLGRARRQQRAPGAATTHSAAPHATTRCNPASTVPSLSSTTTTTSTPTRRRTAG